MEKLKESDLYSLEQYARIREEFRNKVIIHKKNRRLALGEHAALYFEDRLTMQYQVQEMLRLERIFEPELIREELDVYNPLIPDGMNWKATFMLEYADEGERRSALSRLVGIERNIWIRVEGFDKVRPHANEDMERATDDKTASVHFLRFELDPEMIESIGKGNRVHAGIDHPAYHSECDIPEEVMTSLKNDFV